MEQSENNMKKTDIISGAGGFLGSNLVEYCLKEGYCVVAISSQKNKLIRKFGQYPGFEVFSTTELEKVYWEKGDSFINCAFPRNADSIQLPKGMDAVSKLLESAVRGKVKSIINISSQSVYSSQRKFPAKEADELCLENKYAIGKYSMELLTNALCRKIPHTNLRMASLIGPEFDQRVTNKMIDIALKSGKLMVKKNAQKFGFLDINDAISAIILLLRQNPKYWKEIYNVGTDHTYSLLEIAESVKNTIYLKTGRNIEIEIEADEKELNTALDCSRLYKDTGFSPFVSLDNSVLYILESKLLRKE